MVDRPPARAALMIRDPGLALDQQPAARVVPVNLRPGQQIRVRGEQLLQLRLRFVTRARRRGETAVVVNQEDRVGHDGDVTPLIQLA